MRTTAGCVAIAGVAGLVWLVKAKAPGHDVPLSPPKKTRSDAKAAQKRFDDLVKAMGATGDSYLVVGVGFLGCHIVKALLKRGEKRIKCVDLSCSKLLAKLLEDNPQQLTYIKGDVTNFDDLKAATAGVDTVFCTFAVIRYWETLPSQRALSHRINRGGTETLIRACKECGVKRLLQTSTSNATVTTAHISSGPDCTATVMDEDSPYVTEDNRINHYGPSKVAAEKLVLEANGADLATASLRPCSAVIGANDNINLEIVLRKKKIPAIVSWPVIDIIYVDNVVWGELLLEQRMRDPKTLAQVCGQVFAVSNREPMSTREYHSMIKNHGDGVVIESQPIYVLHILAFVNRWLFSLPPPANVVTQAMLNTVRCQYVYKDHKAERLLGYEPVFSVEEGIIQSIIEGPLQ